MRERGSGSEGQAVEPPPACSRGEGWDAGPYVLAGPGCGARAGGLHAAGRLTGPASPQPEEDTQAPAGPD